MIISAFLDDFSGGILPDVVAPKVSTNFVFVGSQNE